MRFWFDVSGEGYHSGLFKQNLHSLLVNNSKTQVFIVLQLITVKGSIYSRNLTQTTIFNAPTVKKINKSQLLLLACRLKLCMHCISRKFVVNHQFWKLVKPSCKSPFSRCHHSIIFCLCVFLYMIAWMTQVGFACMHASVHMHMKNFQF